MCFYLVRGTVLSEIYDTPVMLRTVTRIAHSQSLVETSERVEPPLRPYVKDAQKYVSMPAVAVKRHVVVEKHIEELRKYTETCDFNREEMRDPEIGFVTSGAAYQYVREAFPNASVFKIGMVYPLPIERIRAFAAKVDRLFVVEELDPFIETAMRAAGIAIAGGKDRTGLLGELSQYRVRKAMGASLPPTKTLGENLPGRPPVMCAGCPHRLVFNELRRMKAIVTGDIGCYTLGAVAPFRAVDSVIDMGASLSMSHGMELAGIPERTKRPVIGVIGDSTFAHSGITSLLGTAYNGGKGTLLILDNRTTAMTGTQGNPVNGLTLSEQGARISPLADADEKPSVLDRPAGRPLDLPALCRAIGVDEVIEADAQDLKAVRAALKEAVSHEDLLSVVIFRSPCRLVDRTHKPVPVIRDCRRCGTCIQIGCPALGKDETNYAIIDPTQCVGCGQCEQVCPFGCITSE